MKTIKAIKNVPLTRLQQTLLERYRARLPDLTDEEVERYVVAQGILTVGTDLPDVEFPLNATTKDHPRRHVEEEIKLRLNEPLRQRLEMLLNARPNLSEAQIVATLLELGLESLVELGVLRKKDVSLPTTVASPAVASEE